MSSSGRFRLTPGMLLRMTADALFVNLALLLALALRFIQLVGQHVDGPARAATDTEALYQEFLRAYWHNAPFLTAITLAVFTGLGFYTFGVLYNCRFKPIIIVKALAAAFGLFALFSFFFADFIKLEPVPRGALLYALAFSILLCGGARVCSFLWDRVVRPEKEQQLKRKRPAGKHVLVIGGAGYIGSALLPMLLEKGIKVRVLDRFLYGSDPIGKYVGHPKLELIKGDFRHVEKVMQAMNGVDSVIHLGAIVGDPGCNLDEKVTKDVNLVATKTIAEIAKMAGVSRFIFASTCSVYGATNLTLDESSDVEPISLYGRTKLVAEHGLLKMADENFSPTILRFATIYGFSGRTRFDLVVNLLTAMAKIEGKITVHGGDQWRPFVHVQDAALAVFMMLSAPLDKVGNQIFNVGCDEQNATIEDIGKLIHQYVPSAQLMINNDTTDKRNYRVSFKKIRDTIAYQPRWTLREGIEQVLEAVATGQVVNFREPKYSNVRFLSETGLIELLRVDDDWSQKLKEIEDSHHEIDMIQTRAPAQGDTASAKQGAKLVRT